MFQMYLFPSLELDSYCLFANYNNAASIIISPVLQNENKITFFESDNFSENRKEFEMTQLLFFETLTDKVSNLHFFFLGKLVKTTDIRYQYQCGTMKLSIENVSQNNLNYRWAP